MPTSLERAAPAKVNLALHVTGRRADGYHLLESLVAFTRHGDLLRAEAAEDDSFFVCGRFAPDVPADGGNLVLRARDLMRRRFGAPAQMPVALKLEKNLPVASGIGGGSSDAAAAMRLLARHWGIAAEEESLAELGLTLGADVPMCLAGRALLARGIGEAVEPVMLPALPLLLVNPGLPLATANVFGALRERENPALPPFRGGGLADIIRWLGTTRNDLEAPALALLPQIGEVLDALRAQGALLARMSGSGATCFGIFASEAETAYAEKAIAKRRPEWFAQATITMPAAEADRNG